jgi:hypothetical protein
MSQSGSKKPWVGFDLDRTIAERHDWNGEEIGKPIPSMIALVRKFLSQGKMVKIFTARADRPRTDPVYGKIETWCIQHIGQKLEVTNAKDRYCEALYDDIAHGIVPNKGILVEDELETAKRYIKALKGTK